MIRQLTPVEQAAAAYADLWLCDLNTAADTDLLSPDEQARAARLLIPDKRRRFIAARVVLRSVLARYVQRPPGALLFDYGPQGKPALRDHDGWQFSLSHSEDTALIAVTRSPVGVDLEHLRPFSAMSQMAAMAFTEQEQTALYALPPHDQLTAFFRVWTRKEALMKADGRGFQRAQTFGVPVTAQTQTIHLDGWTIHDLDLPGDRIAALAVADSAP